MGTPALAHWSCSLSLLFHFTSNLLTKNSLSSFWRLFAHRFILLLLFAIYFSPSVRKMQRQSHWIFIPLFADFLILFFTEALFYCGVAAFLLIIDRSRKTSGKVPQNRINPSQLGQRISSVATLVLSLMIPMVTMGFVWPWTGPAASATLAPYLVGIVVQFAFEQYARYRNFPSSPIIPIIFQVCDHSFNQHLSKDISL